MFGVVSFSDAKILKSRSELTPGAEQSKEHPPGTSRNSLQSLSFAVHLCGLRPLAKTGCGVPACNRD
jgi:hypothetical protein